MIDSAILWQLIENIRIHKKSEDEWTPTVVLVQFFLKHTTQDVFDKVCKELQDHLNFCENESTNNVIQFSDYQK